VRPKRPHLVIVLMGLVLLGAYWGVRAQEGPRWAPPAVLPPDDLPAPTVTKGVEKTASKYANPAQPLRDKAKADPTLIVPAEVYEAPRPLGPNAPEPKPAIVQVGGVAPPPLPLLPAMESKEAKMPPPLPALPSMEVAPLVPMPMPILEPTKALIVDTPVKKAAPLEVPVQAPLVMPPPIALPEAKANPVAPPIMMPPPAALPETKQVPVAPSSDQPGAFVRIQSGPSGPAPVLARPDSIVPERPQPLQATQQIANLTPPPANPEPAGAPLMSLQSPVVTVRKYGPARFQAGETITYQIVVRNLGAVPAQQIRIEDELPESAVLKTADPMPQIQGVKSNQAIWVVSALPPNGERVIQFTLRAGTAGQAPNNTRVHVATTSQTTTTALRSRNDAAALAIELVAPNQVAVGKTAVFDIRVTNQSTQPLTGIVLHGTLPDGLNTPAGRTIEGEVDGSIAPGETKTLKMPTDVVKAGRHTVHVKVATQSGEASAQADLDVGSATLLLQQAPATRLFLGRDGDLRVELANNTGRPLRNVAVADRLPEGLEFVAASERGLYQANSRTVYWLIDQLPAGKTQTLMVRVNGSKSGSLNNVVFAKADGIPEMQSASAVALEGSADLTLRVIDRDYLVEIGKENVYEIQVLNPGHAPAGNVQVQVEFPAGLTPKAVQGDTRYSIDRQRVVFEPIPSLGAQGQIVFRVSATAQAMGDQRVRFTVVSDQVRVPIQREISTRVVER
jgi:uncharacterized repeat protein (TIGR01451 family)